MLVLFCLLGLSQAPLADRPMILDCAANRAAAAYVLVTTPAGIWQFNRSTDAWTFRKTPASPIGFIAVTGESLWVITPRGAAVAGIKEGPWRPVKITGRVRSLAFADDVFWAGGDSGLLYLDRKTGVWRQRAEFVVNDLLCLNDRLWIASDAGAFRYDPKPDLVHQFPTQEAGFNHVVATASNVWFMGEKSLATARFGADTACSFYGVPITGYSSSGDSFFITSRGGAFVYVPDSGKFVELADRHPLRGVEAVSVEGPNVWFAAVDGLRRYSVADTARQVWNRDSGLAGDSLRAVHADTRFVYTVNRRSLQVLDRQENTWKVLSLSGPRRHFLDFLFRRR
jgi:ligand-binding sensor domain-containing protein